MSSRFLVALLVLANTFSFSKTIIFLKDKGVLDSEITLNDLVSPESVARRESQSIPLDSLDFPVNDTYLNQLIAKGVDVEYTSRWLNAVLCEFPTDSTSAISNLSFVDTLINYNTSSNFRKASTVRLAQVGAVAAYAQAEQIELELLHDKGYKGDGIIIAVIDAGFSKYTSFDAFDDIVAHNGIIETYDFVDHEIDVTDDHRHGTSVFSVLAGVDEKYTSTALDAQYLLYRTENVSVETPIEEFYWTVAAERADSLGVDIINMSLGYTTFDNAVFDYTHADLDGESGMITQGANYASSRGILVVVSMGNDAENSWEKMLKPADSDQVLSVGAVNSKGDYASFSSVGPTADGRIKPDVVALGQGTAVVNQNGVVEGGTGTSFAAPVITGLAACVWQAFPDLTNQEVKELIVKSGDKYSNPDNYYGHGLPNAFRIWGIQTGVDEFVEEENITIWLQGLIAFDEKLISFSDLAGNNYAVDDIEFNFESLEKGLYFLRFESGKVRRGVR